MVEQMQSQVQQSQMPMQKPVQESKVTPMPTPTKSNTPIQGQMLPEKKSSKWWLWLLIGIFVGVAGMWAFSNL